MTLLPLLISPFVKQRLSSLLDLDDRDNSQLAAEDAVAADDDDDDDD